MIIYFGTDLTNVRKMAEHNPQKKKKKSLLWKPMDDRDQPNFSMHMA